MKTITCKNNHGKTVKFPISKFTFRPGVYAIILNKKNEVLLTESKSGKLWFPGGGIEIGETIEKALKREVEEETNIKNLKIKELVALFENFFYFKEGDEAWHSHMFFYKCKISSKEKIIRKFADEYEEIGINKLVWINIKNIKKEKFIDINEKVYKMIHKIL
ncbi:MAG: NUDIX hydrolase [Patescibacteria group bacterium]|nr:NUDIX hydrolase [Patescibacteria group bacterium]MDD4304143.1 NUDIX hydrolase [Patescibacteria group bacterium]MDD4695174.1 NUDIX hydrolase [Patescibacteria group bacterium]